MKNKIKPKITLHIPEEIWAKFKEITPRQVTLNDQIIMLVQEFIGKKGKNGT